MKRFIFLSLIVLILVSNYAFAKTFVLDGANIKCLDDNIILFEDTIANNIKMWDKSIEDFLAKVKVNKVQMINLIKSGAFDSFGDRVELMHKYVDMITLLHIHKQ